jgi:hypothetical protein
MITNKRENENDNEIKLTMYADDTGAAVETLDSIDEFVKEFKKFKHIMISLRY